MYLVSNTPKLSVVNTTEERKKVSLKAMGFENFFSITDIFLGPICDYVLAPVARYCQVWKTPIISGGLNAAFDLKTRFFGTLTRVLGGYNQIANATREILHKYNWTNVAFFCHNFNSSLEKGHSDCYMSLAAVLNVKTGLVYHKIIYDEDEATYENYKEYINDIKSKVRIIILCGKPSTIREILLAANELNMIDKGEYVFINIDIFGSIQTQSKPWKVETDTDENNESARKAFTSLLTVTTRQPDDQNYLKFSEQVKTLARTNHNYTFEEHEIVSHHVATFFDAVLLFAYALNNSIAEIGDRALNEPLNGTRIAHLMWGRSFHGITGQVTIDANGDRLSDYSLFDMNPETSEFEVVAIYFHDKGFQFVEGKKIHWAGDRTTAPLDRPTCGFDNSLCPDKSFPAYAILSLILSLAMITMTIFSVLGYRHYRLEAEISSMTWKINYNDVLHGSSLNQRNSVHSRTASQLSVLSDDMTSLPGQGERQLYIPMGFYKGNKVAIKTIGISSINLTRSLMLELKTMKDLQHDHLVRFYGACVDGSPTCLLTEYCPKGSLQDILENEEIKLDWMFKLSLMHDIVKGMHFLHSTVIASHGSLKSSNCVVDSRFVLKITDFGLYQLRRKINGDYDLESYEYWKKFLWTSPELLRLSNSPPEGTKQGDVYSFAIIVNEIVTRQGPFYLGSDSILTPKEIVKNVKNSNNPPNHFRPKIEFLNSNGVWETEHEDVINIMTKCWHEDPLERPTFSALKGIIRKINKENESGNILDNLLHRMEQYANNLEYLVEERTKNYFEEKRKCEDLLYQLLPRSVAAQLIVGKPVLAETYDQVTIYFSDIVGFTSISSESSPMQVVDLLNDLYTCFDSIVENFDVYKVETIGDAYMVVSGLPVRNGNLHAREIARTALAILKAVQTNFFIRHRPNEQIRLRIGLHSGACVAGVVGLKMPRYCLFGDSVNVASRMESNGEPLKIHISHTTKQFLDSFGNFDIEVRGLVPIKGKGDMLTFWLKGENPSGDLDFPSKFTSNETKTKKNDLKNSNLSAKKSNLVRNHSNDSNFSSKISNGENNNHIRTSFFNDKRENRDKIINDADLMQNLMVKWKSEN